jgi:hypothetical protein
VEVNGMTELPDFVLQALNAPRNDGAQFTALVAAFGQQFSSTLQLPIRHETDMNYCAGQSLRFELRAKQPNSSPKNLGALFEVMVFLSSKAPVFAWYCFDRHGVFSKAHFPLLGPNQWPDSVRLMVSRLQPILVKAGWREVPFEILDAPAQNCVTDLDGSPATVFDALFAEIV